jgi:xanthine dehydrogenase YagR molybdenum-binding subunit
LQVLQDDRVRFYGQPIAVVIAETLDQAEHAALALRVVYSAEQPIVDPLHPEAQAIIPEAAKQPSARIQADKSRGDADIALRRAPVKVDATYDMARENHNPMEPHATVAAWSGDSLTLWSKNQFVVNERAEIAAVFGIPPDKVLVICPFIGGAFGTTLRTWPHVTLAALAARQIGRPVKLVLTRKQPAEHGFCEVLSTSGRTNSRTGHRTGMIQSPPAAGKDETAEYDRSPWFRKCPDNNEGKHVRAHVPDAQ